MSVYSKYPKANAPKKAPTATVSQLEWIGKCLQDRVMSIRQRDEYARRARKEGLDKAEAGALLDELFALPKLADAHLVPEGLYYHAATLFIVTPNKASTGLYALALKPDNKGYTLIYDKAYRAMLSLDEKIGLADIPAGILANCNAYAKGKIEAAGAK